MKKLVTNCLQRFYLVKKDDIRQSRQKSGDLYTTLTWQKDRTRILVADSKEIVTQIIKLKNNIHDIECDIVLLLV